MVKAYRLGAERLAELERALADDDEGALFELDEAVGEAVYNESCDVAWEAISRPRRLYLACRQLTADEGVNQFMSSWGPEAVLDAAAFFEQRGLKDGARLLRLAIAALPGRVLPETHGQLEAVLLAGGVEDAHEEIDDELMDLELDEDLVRGRMEFVREFAGEFFEG